MNNQLSKIRLLHTYVMNRMFYFERYYRSYFQARIILFCSLNIDEQSDIIMQEYTTGWAARAAQNPNDEILKSGVKPVRMTYYNYIMYIQSSLLIPG